MFIYFIYLILEFVSDSNMILLQFNLCLSLDVVLFSEHWAIFKSRIDFKAVEINRPGGSILICVETYRSKHGPFLSRKLTFPVSC